MSERRRRGTGPGWFVSLAGALGLVVVGFTVGLLAGVAFEAPGLVASHVAGGTQDVDLASLGDASAPVSDPPLGAHPAQLAQRSEAKPPEPSAERSALPAVSAPAPRRGFVVQVGSFAERSSALALSDRLEGSGLPSYVEPTPGRSSWRVRVGPWTDEGEAERVATRLEQREKLDTWVLEAERP